MQPVILPEPETLSREQLVAEVRDLRAQSASLAQMFEQAPSFIALLTGPEHRFALTNAAYQRAIDGRAVTGSTVAEALPDAAAQGYVHLLDEVFRSGVAHKATAARYDVQSTPGGPVNERYLDFVYQPITDAHGAVSGIFVEGHDVTERTLSEAALRRNEARYRTLFESIEVGFCIVEMRFDGTRAVDYRILEANPAFVRQTGADVAGQWVSEFAPDLERHWFDTYGGVALTGEPAHFEHYAEVFGRWFDVRALRTGDPAENHVAIFFSDITERRTVEKRAEAGERDLRLITDALPVLISFIGADHVYRFANKAYDDWFSIPAVEVVGRDVRDLLGPEAYEARRPQMDRALAGEAVTFELDWPRRDGEPRIAEIRYLPRRTANGTVDGFHVFVHDVTARKRTEADLARQVAARTAERDQVWQASSDMLCVANLDGYFVSLNPAWPATLGWSEAELRARPFLDFVHPDDVAATLSAATGLARGEPQITFENRYRHKDGSDIWLSWNAVPRDGLVYASVRNVSEIKRQTEALRLTEEALRQSQKMEAVGQLTGGLAVERQQVVLG